MAVGMDRAISRPLPSPLAPQRQYRAPAISDTAVQSAVNNQLAAGYGARETSLAGAARQGISRGKGQRYDARMAQEQADATAAAGAAGTELSAATSNAAAQQAYDNQMRSERLAQSGLLEGLRNTAAMERMARRGWGQDSYEAWRRGRFGWDQQQIDYSPLLAGLFG